MPSLQYSSLDLRRRERFVLSLFFFSETPFPYFPFFFWGMWHICISQLGLIRICWLKVNEINSSWWHWVRLLLRLNSRRTVEPLITCSQSRTFVSTNVRLCCLTVIRYFFSLPILPAPTRQSADAQKSVLNYLSISGLPFLPWERFCDWRRLASVWKTPASPTPTRSLTTRPSLPLPLHLSRRRWILIEAWLSDNLLWHCSGRHPALCWPLCLEDERRVVAIVAAKKTKHCPRAYGV